MAAFSTFKIGKHRWTPSSNTAKNIKMRFIRESRKMICKKSSTKWQIQQFLTKKLKLHIRLFLQSKKQLSPPIYFLCTLCNSFVRAQKKIFLIIMSNTAN